MLNPDWLAGHQPGRTAPRSAPVANRGPPAPSAGTSTLWATRRLFQDWASPSGPLPAHRRYTGRTIGTPCSASTTFAVGRSLFLPVPARRGSRINNRDRERSRRKRRDDLRRESCRSCGHVFSSRTSPPGGSSRTGARRGTRRAPAPKVGVRHWSASSSTVAPRPWWAAIAFTKSPRTRSASDTMRSARSQAGRLVAAGDAGPNRFRSGAPSPNPAVRRVP